MNDIHIFPHKYEIMGMELRLCYSMSPYATSSYIFVTLIISTYASTEASSSFHAPWDNHLTVQPRTYMRMEFCSCARGRRWCGIIHYHWWTASIKPRLLFSRAGYASWGLFLSWVCYLVSSPFFGYIYSQRMTNIQTITVGPIQLPCYWRVETFIFFSKSWVKICQNKTK